MVVHSASSSFQPRLIKIGVIPLRSSSLALVLPHRTSISWLQNRHNMGQGRVTHSRCTPSSAAASQQSGRRSANYHPTIWDHQVIESLKNPYTNEVSHGRLEELKKEVKKLIQSTKDPLVQLKLIDSIRRLGVAYHFQDEIKESLLQLVHLECNHDLYTAALKFRIFREHGYQISSDVFNEFKNKDGSFMDCLSKEADKGLLGLYEASYLGMSGEDVLEEAMEFSISRLKSSMMTEQVRQSLEVPLYWRMVRLEARNFLNIYEEEEEHRKSSSSTLVELAKLDFNIVQSVHQRELHDLSRWWRDLAFEEELLFARDRLVENFLWAVGIIYEPRFSRCRKDLTKLISILTVIDDIYDVYGSLDELELFTRAVEQWDVKALEDLPNYMKSCYLALFNFGNGIAYDLQRDHGLSILPYVKQEWARLCRAYLVEAKWFHKGYTPGLEEYLANAWISVGGPIAMVHAYLLQLEGHNLPNGSLDCLNNGSELVYWSSIITRLTDDLGTSQAEMERGDVPKSIQCYMKENGVSEGEARERIMGLVRDSWKNLNKCAQSSGLPRRVVDMALNMARTSQCIFQHGDGIGTAAGVTKDRVVSLFIEPLP
ncbi:probable terpene synthase 9 [Macadamia integrifolia]|uniref:probable terpene synthase 9 n=1 Tax=Macadamia integrifolia TaxID=60698 RepID=UPI001C4F14E1|nr:probable terpene synthase 9 [Macadamia integrifolia]